MVSIGEVYEDRNLVVLLLLKLLRDRGFEVGYRIDPEEPEWPVVYANSPNIGQISWHIPQKDLPDWIEEGELEYNGHTNEEKNRRVREFIKYI